MMSRSSCRMGALVRLIRAACADDWARPAPSLDTIIADDEFQGFPGPPPTIPVPRALMLLHASGRSFFAGPRSPGSDHPLGYH